MSLLLRKVTISMIPRQKKLRKRKMKRLKEEVDEGEVKEEVSLKLELMDK